MASRLPSSDLASDAVDPNFNFRRALKDIDDDLTSTDIASLKFLCRDFIPSSKLESARGPLDVFRLLENKGLLGQHNLMFLTELLYRIQRADLLRKLTWNPGQVSKEIERGRGQLSPFRVMLLQLSEELTRRDFDDMKFMAAAYISRNKLEMVDSFLSLAVALEQGMYLTSSNVQVLHELLQTHERPDLKNIVQKYEATLSTRSGSGKISPDEGFSPSPMDTTAQHKLQEPQPVKPPPQNQNLANQMSNLVAMTENMIQPAQGYPQMVRTELMQQAGRVADSQARQTARVADQQPHDLQQEEVAGFGPAPPDLQATIQRELEIRLEQERARQRQEMPSYEMDRNPRGLAVIVNNKTFYHDIRNANSKRGLENREGTNVDRDNLIYIFNKIGFQVVTQENITHDQLVKLFTEVRQTDHSNYDCFVACILSHGSQGRVFGSDSVPVSIRDLGEEIKSIKCPSLAGKPKLFFIQACQGRLEQIGVSDISADAGSPPGLDAFQETIPNEADFLLSYSTIPGYVSYRSKTQGSWFVTKLVETLDNMGDRHDLLSILIKVNEEVGKAIARKGGGQFKQSPAPVATLRKKIFFSFLREARRPQVRPAAPTTNTAV